MPYTNDFVCNGPSSICWRPLLFYLITRECFLPEYPQPSDRPNIVVLVRCSSLRSLIRTGINEENCRSRMFSRDNVSREAAPHDRFYRSHLKSSAIDSRTYSFRNVFCPSGAVDKQDLFPIRLFRCLDRAPGE